MDDARAFWNRVAGRYAARPIPDTQAYEQTLARCRAWLTPDDDVLELGCGTGSTALELAGSVRRYTATDFAPAMIAIAHERIGAAGIAGLEARVAAIGDPDLAGGDRDAVLALNLLHLLDDLPGALEDIGAMLRPGGLFISKSFCLPDRGGGGWTLALMRLALPLMQWAGKAPRVAFRRIGALEQAISQAGFEIVETGNHPAAPPRRFIVARKL